MSINKKYLKSKIKENLDLEKAKHNENVNYLLKYRDGIIDHVELNIIKSKSGYISFSTIEICEIINSLATEEEFIFELTSGKITPNSARDAFSTILKDYGFYVDDGKSYLRVYIDFKDYMGYFQIAKNFRLEIFTFILFCFFMITFLKFST